MIIYPSKIMVMKLKDFVDVQAMNMLFFQGQGSTEPFDTTVTSDNKADLAQTVGLETPD